MMMEDLDTLIETIKENDEEYDSPFLSEMDYCCCCEEKLFSNDVV